ncbi:tRNA lysidine(34) synthetase TilS [Alteraurantiacibacter palmitatis]|uniref:tRNA(Ile)-lysidine synthase n=1 Tax=Alteraurantiacibacter palmitatis TaxID=2054628 RepID=A0ABV7E9H0_9SPHN
MTQRGAVSAASKAIPAELAGRFKAALDRLNAGDGRIGLAVSGGPDSLAMLLLAHAAIPGRFAVATVDHGLRPEATEEGALVAQVCAVLGIACDILSVDVAPGNVQAEARRARYAALEDWAVRQGLAAVATAHHADDQAETLLMRLNRGSGLAGLAGVRSTGAIGNLRVIRPLLDWRRAELAAICRLAAITPAQDPSNSNADYDRVRIRQELARADWLDPLALARSARLLAEAEAFVEQTVEGDWLNRVSCQGQQWRFAPCVSAFANVEIVRRILRRLGGEVSRTDLARMVERLAQGQSASLAGVLARVENGAWLFSPEPPRKSG